MSENRRPVSSRGVSLFHRLAAALVRFGLTPNQVSVASGFFGITAGLAIAFTTHVSNPLSIVLLVMALVFVHLRLLCNLIDGLMAVEGGLKTPTGEIYNDLPDRVSDVAVFVGMGYAALPLVSWATDLGWLAAVLAVMTAYVRVLGASMGTAHFFSGPMAKQHRMFLVNLACLGSIFEIFFGLWGYSLIAMLFLIATGCLFTCARRLGLITRGISERSV